MLLHRCNTSCPDICIDYSTNISPTVLHSPDPLIRKLEYDWLENLRQSLSFKETEGRLLDLNDATNPTNIPESFAFGHDPEPRSYLNTSWAAYHAEEQKRENMLEQCSTALLPLFLENAHSVAMIKHAIDVVGKAVHFLNPCQVPVIAFDQPLFALTKEIQWKWPETHGESKLVVMFGGLHIEMTFQRTLGDWLKGSGRTECLDMAEIASTRKAESFLMLLMSPEQDTRSLLGLSIYCIIRHTLNETTTSKLWKNFARS